MAQGLGTGCANVFSGALKTLLIESHLFLPGPGYAFIFGLEALTMVLAVIVLRSISLQEFQGLSRTDLEVAAVALETA
jgi:BCD family chlorophyll transporter-like MFS transporter